jgi:O-acetyl-ADP-ribose deacetylase (regulator of RNase III)
VAWRGHGEPDLLADCYRHSLRLAQQHELVSIAFPAISCGVFGYPVDAAATSPCARCAHGCARMRCRNG